MRDLRFFSPQKEIEPATDGLVWAYYDVTSTEAATKVINNTDGIQGNYMYVDGVRVTKATTYPFTTTGRHLVKFPYNTGVGASVNVIAYTPNLVEIYFPAITFRMSYRMFRNDTGLTNVSFVDGATITLFTNGYQFDGCTSLPTLILPLFGDMPPAPFSGCSSLEYIEFSGGGTIGLSTRDVFQDTKIAALKTIVFGPNYTAITGRLAYYTNATAFVVKATTPPTISAPGTSFYRFPSTTKIYVPYSQDHSVLDAYKTETNWSAQASNIYELNPDGSIPTS